jgi:hypothetical protein
MVRWRVRVRRQGSPQRAGSAPVLIRMLAQLLDDRLSHLLVAVRALIQLVGERAVLAVAVAANHLQDHGPAHQG